MGGMEINIHLLPVHNFRKVKKRFMPPSMEWVDNIHLHNKAFHNYAILHGTWLLLFIMIIMPRIDQSWPFDSLLFILSSMFLFK
jgi:hypothetical protein